MYEQINLLGEEVHIASKSKAKKFEDILKELQEVIQGKNERIAYLEERNKVLSEENKDLKIEIKQPQTIELGAFEKSKINHRPLINIFIDWIGYKMFIKDDKYQSLPKEEQAVFGKVWSKYINPTYKEFCKEFANNRLEEL